MIDLTQSSIATGLLQSIRTLPKAAYGLALTLGVLSVLAWIAVAEANMPMAGTFDIVALVLFTLIWGVGMVAMMFPSIIPMVYSIVSAARKTSASPGQVSFSAVLVVWLRAGLFILGYVAVWTLVGLVFYLGVGGLAGIGIDIGLGSFGFWAGIILIAIGIYQFTRFKQKSLMTCRSPIGFIMTNWKNGNNGAFMMGAEYGTSCTKCCWVLMAGLLVVGAMSLPLMGVFAIIIFVEKIAPFGGLVSRIIGGGFIAMGLILLL